MIRLMEKAPIQMVLLKRYDFRCDFIFGDFKKYYNFSNVQVHIQVNTHSNISNKQY